MKPFEQIEKTYRHSPVTGEAQQSSFTGTLTLEGRNSAAVVVGQKPLRFASDENGWFDLRLRAANGVPILLHHALRTQSVRHGLGSDSSHVEHIFPNVVILGANALVDGSLVSRIAFALKDASVFFHYETVEWQSLHEASKDTLRSLRRLRTQRDRRLLYDIFRPSDVYIVHRLPRALKFTVGGNRYEIFIGYQSEGPAWSSIRYESMPIASISFGKPVDIETALDAVWAWKRYLGTVALFPISLAELSIQSGRGTSRQEGDVYLPNMVGSEDQGQPPFTLWLGNVPLNRWRERTALSNAMQSWIESERKVFRGALEKVCGEMGRRVSLDQVTTLCSGIESLKELTNSGSLDQKHVATIADGAIRAAHEHGIDVSDDRIRGVVGFLRRHSLPQRLNALFARTGMLSSARAKLLQSTIIELRTIAAHGAPSRGDVIPRAAPTVAALASLCAIYDLTSCGVPIRGASNQPLGVFNYLQEAIQQLEQLTTN